MGSQDIDLVPPQRLDNGLNSQMVFEDSNLQFSRAPDRKLFSVDREFFREDFRRNIYDSRGPRDDPPERQDWNADGSTGTPTGEDDDDDDDDEDEDDGDAEGDGEVEGLVTVERNKNTTNNSSSSVQSSSEKIRNENMILQKQHSFGSCRGVLVKDSGIVHSGNGIRGNLSEPQHRIRRMGHYDNAIAIGDPDIYYQQILQGPDGTSVAQKEIGADNGCGFSGRKDASISYESGESLRGILSDPLTGALMDDAIILPCGHSFGSGGLQHVLRLKSCTCGHAISEDSVAPNLALRSAVHAFCREEELQTSRACKRRRDRYEQENCSYGDPFLLDPSRGKGVQFPFVVTDRVIIKGNKRTPQRFVGREAVVTTQCLNG
ncbi:U-box domain-containing protein 62-like isoform X2 [Aristolochia californica]